MHPLKMIWPLTRRTLGQFGADNCSQMAAAIAYYVLFSLIPLLIFVVSVFGFVARDSDVEERIIDRVVGSMPLDEEEGADLVSDTIHGVSRVSGALSVFSILLMAWSASSMFGAIRKSLNVVWHVEVARPVVQQKLVDLAMVAALGVLLTASIAGTAALRTLRELSDDALGPLSTNTNVLWTLAPLALPALLSLAVFLFLYRFVPHTSNRLRDVWPGALVATVLFELLKNGFTFYVAKFNNYDIVYGSLGAVMLFLLWTYLSANILLLGAELAHEYPRVMRGDYAGMPAESAMAEVRRFVRGLFFREREAPAPQPSVSSDPKAGSGAPEARA